MNNSIKLTIVGVFRVNKLRKKPFHFPLSTYYLTLMGQNERVNQTDYYWSFCVIINIRNAEPGSQHSSHSY